MTLNYQIIEEVILEEKGHIYEIVVRAYGSSGSFRQKLKFGPKLLQNKMKYFIKMAS